jgi:predicted permease
MRRRARRAPLGLRAATRLLPPEVRDEVLRELLEQHARHRHARGRLAAWRWTWRQPWAAWLARDARDAHRGRGWIGRGVLADLALSQRTLRRRPALASTLVATIAVCVGAVAAIAGIVDAVLLRPLPYPDAHQLVWISSYQTSPTSAPFDPARAASAYANPLDVVDWEQRARRVAALTPFETFTATVQTGERPLRVDGASLRAAVGAVLRVPALHGRLFTEADYAPGARVMVISHRLWRTAFGADVSIVGRSVPLDGDSFEIVGVLPDLPMAFPRAETDVWLPLRPPPPDFANRSGVWQRVVGRLEAGVTLADAQADFDRVTRELAAEHPDTNANRHVRLVPFREGLVGSTDAVLRLIAGSILLVLVIACANVGHLLLVNAHARRRELAVRAALGAEPRHLVRLLVAECAWLALAGGLLGLLLAPWFLTAFLRLYPDTLPAVGRVGLSLGAVCAAIAATTLAGLLALIPTLVSLRGARGRRLQAAMRATERGAEDRGQRAARAALVMTQVALSAALLLGGGLLLRTFDTLRGTDLGFAAGDVLTFNVALGERTYPTLADEVRLYDALLDQIRALPGVESAGATTLLPLTSDDFIDGFRRVGFDDRFPDVPVARLQNVTAGYLEAIGLRLRAGRTIQATDTSGSPPVVVVNEAFEQQYFPDGAVGRQIRFRDTVAEVVGVVSDKQHRSLREQPRADMYFPRSQVEHPRLFAWFAIRGRDPARLLPAVRELVGGLDAGVALDDVGMMEERVDAALGPDRFRAYLVSALALVALVLAGLGLYALIAFAVARDTRDVAIRMALGATAGRTAWRVVGGVLLLAAGGLGAGLTLAYASRTLLARFLAGATAFDPVTVAAVGAVVLAAAALAAAGPAVRATRIDPAEVLRTQ